MLSEDCESSVQVTNFKKRFLELTEVRDRNVLRTQIPGFRLSAFPNTGIAEDHGRSVSQIIFRFALDVGMIPLTGTTNAEQLRADLVIFSFQLEPDEVKQIERMGVA